MTGKTGENQVKTVIVYRKMTFSLIKFQLYNHNPKSKVARHLKLVS